MLRLHATGRGFFFRAFLASIGCLCGPIQWFHLQLSEIHNNPL